MIAYLLKRLGLVVPIALAVSVVCFTLVYLAPGDPLSAIVPSDASKEMIDELKKEYGFDKPIPVQYAVWLGRVLQGNLGQSIATGRPVATEIGNAIGNTLILAFAASLVGFTLGAVLGDDRRLLQRLVDRQGGVGHRGGRRLGAALLARHGAGDRLLGHPGLAAGDGRRAGRLGRVDLGRRAREAPDPARPSRCRSFRRAS